MVDEIWGQKEQAHPRAIKDERVASGRDGFFILVEDTGTLWTKRGPLGACVLFPE